MNGQIRKTKKKKGNSGQTFVEFVLLMIMIVSVSLLLYRLTTATSTKLWWAAVTIIANDGKENGIPVSF